MKLEDATAQTARCFRGEPASCSCGCPFSLDVRSFVDKVRKGRWTAAYKMLRDATVFPLIVSVLCDEPCQALCQRALLGDEAIAVRDLEAATIRFARERNPESYAIPPKGQRIAVIGAGPAGLSTALHLAQKRFPVDVFEQQDGWGGSLRSHPSWADFHADIALQFGAVQVEFHYGTRIRSLDELSEFQAVYVATGADGESFGLLPDWKPEVLATPAEKVFLGGELTGATPMEGIAQGLVASRVIEGFVQTGKASLPAGTPTGRECARYVEHPGAVHEQRVQASAAGGYTEQEAKAEAARCFLCDCDTCLAACEMLKRFRKDPKKIGLEVYTDMGATPPLSVHSLTREAYSCNTCGYCSSVCPEDVDMGAVLQLSRAARMSAGVQPAALHDFWLREMDFATSEGSFASAPEEQETCDYVFYPGCQLGASSPEHVLRSYDFLASRFDAGVFLSCCGAPAYWAGDDDRLRANIGETRDVWEELGRPTFVFTCATCMKLFALFLPEVPRVSLYELLAASDADTPAPPFTEAAIFDPCAARGQEEMETAVRALVRKIGIDAVELPERNRCCGYGGHIRLANPSLYDEITKHRVEASERPYVVYCANCKEVFASREKECAHVLDAFFGLNPRLATTSLEQKRENSLRVKRELMKQIRHVDFEPHRDPWDSLTLVIGDDLQRELDQKLISSADLKETISLAEASGDVFYDESDGTRLASMVKPVITYWVQYRETGPQTYQVLSAYYHRMRFQQGE